MRRVILGVSAGIAAYRSCDLVGRLRDRGIETRVVMTPRATRFVAPRTFAALTGHTVLVDELESEPSAEIPHIAWARWAELVVVAPATADLIGRVAHGLADDSLTALLLAIEESKPVLLAPAMNHVMWENRFVQANLARLAEIGGGRFVIIPPVDKRLACGESGAGGLPTSEALADRVAVELGRIDARSP